MNKSPLTAFFLSFLPGVGHAYLGRIVRAVIYGGGFFMPLGILFLVVISGSYGDEDLVVFLLIIALGFAFINMLDMILTLISGKALNPQMYSPPPGPYGEMHDTQMGGPNKFAFSHEHFRQQTQAEQQEKTRTIALSMVPGLGHMSMGLMQRGISFLVSFVGVLVIILFLSMVMHTGIILVFLLVLPVIWVYGIFDVIQRLHAKQLGERVDDRSMFEDLAAHIGTGNKNKVLAISLSIFPGAGHLYLGLQKRGLQLMAGLLWIISDYPCFYSFCRSSGASRFLMRCSKQPAMNVKR